MKDFITGKEALSSWKIDEIDLITDALSEQDILMELWHREEKSFFAPAGEWKNDYFIAEVFKPITFVYLFFSIMLVIPMIFFIPFLIKKFFERRSLRTQIINERIKICSSTPIPIIGDEVYSELEKSYWGKRLIDAGVIYKVSL